MRKPTAIDLFSGCGGLTEGLRQGGFRVLGAIEIHNLAVETYRSNHPTVRLWQEDIRKLEAKSLMKELELESGELDLLAGCPPCQGFSRMRNRNGKHRIREELNDLIYEFLRFARVLRPRAIMLENVPGLARNYRLKEFCRALRVIGYSVEYRILDAAAFGVPQRRRRLILLAAREGQIEFSQPDGGARTVRDAIVGLPRPGNSGDPIHDLPEHRSAKVQERIKNIPKDGGSRSALGPENQLDCHVKTDGFKDVYGRMAWDAVSPTMTTGCFNPSKGRFLHPTENRAITMREAAILQSFPQSYFFSTRKGKVGVAWLIGNALPPKFVEHHARKLRTYLQKGFVPRDHNA